MNTDPNPYQSPVAVESEASKATNSEHFLGWSGVWILVLGMNLPIPFLFASFAVEGSTWIGIGIALVALLMCGFTAARYRPRQIQVVATGGLLTAASQFIPLLHIFCGSVAFLVCEAIGLASNPDDTLTTLHGPLGGFVATLLTALPIIAFAWAAGFIVRSFQIWHSNGKKS